MATRARTTPTASGRAPAWAIAAAVIGGVGAVGLGVALAILLAGGDEQGLGAASPTGSVAATDAVPGSDAPETDGGTMEPSPDDASSPPTASPAPTPLPAFANRSILVVSTDALNLRSQPSTDAPVLGVLERGARVFTIGQPQDAGEERWYRVAVVAGPYSECRDDSCPEDIGWASVGDAAAEAYLQAVTLECPTSPMTSAQLATLRPLERLSCYGGTPITVTGAVDYCYCDGSFVVEYEPFWLAEPIAQFMFHGTQGLWLRFEDMPGGPEGLVAGDIVEVSVAMEHEAAADCTVSPPSSDVPSRADVVLDCRTQLVVEELRVTGHDPAISSPPAGG